MSVEFHPLTVEVRPETSDSVVVSFNVPDDLADSFRHIPGQHLVLRTELGGDDVRRSYSVCTPRGASRPAVGIKQIPGGLFSTWATTELATGDTVQVMAPIGEFGYLPQPGVARNYVGLAAGSGITPVLSILSSILDVEQGSTVTLVYGNRSSASVMFVEELEALKNRHPERFRIAHILSREAHQVPFFEGRIDDKKLRVLAANLIDVDSVDDWFLCGPLDMVSTARSTLADLGVDEASVHFELFFDERIEAPEAADAFDPTLQAELKFTLEGRGSSVAVGVEPDGPSLLDYARTVRSDVPFACKGGMCATCKAKVVEGEAVMKKNYALGDDELGKGFILSCQATPKPGSEGRVIEITYDV